MAKTIIDKFEGEFSFLSNFHHAPIMYQDKKFPTSEHLYQWAKTMDEKYDDDSQLAECPEAIKGYRIFDPITEEIRDKYLVSEPIARKLLVDCIRLRRREKI